jgi:hypothetical protein
LDRKITEGEEWIDSSLRDRILALDPAVVKRVQQTVAADPYLSFRKAPVCPEWLGGECRHGSACFFAHELPGPGEHSPDFSKFGIRCRFLGTVDPNGKAIVEQLLLMDQAAFGKKEEEVEVVQVREEPREKEEEEGEGVMTLPEVEEIAEGEEPIGYDGIGDIDLSLLPRFIGGKLVLGKRL